MAEVGRGGSRQAEEKQLKIEKLFTKKTQKYSQLSSSEDSGVCVPVFTPFVDGLGPRDRRPFRMSEFRSFNTMFIFRLAILTDFFSTVSDVQDKYFLKYHCFLSTAANYAIFLLRSPSKLSIRAPWMSDG